LTKYFEKVKKKIIVGLGSILYGVTLTLKGIISADMRGGLFFGCPRANAAARLEKILNQVSIHIL
jgi:hypothetical protein